MSSRQIVDRRSLCLARAVAQLRGFVGFRGLTLPPQIVTEVAATNLGENGRPALGECYASLFEPMGVPRIVINDTLTNPVRILDVTLHELIHCADDGASNHGEWFQGWAKAFGLLGTPSTVASPLLHERLVPIARLLGPYPQPGIVLVLDPEGRLVA